MYLVPTDKNVKTITDMRENALGLLDGVKKRRVTYIFHHSKPRAVMLDVDEFARISELLEDHYDILDAKEIASEPRGRGVPLSEIMKQYE